MSTSPAEDSDSVVGIDVTAELRDSFLEYAYSVIVSRALPDARDGLKPVHRRIVYQMDRMGLDPTKGYVKSARVVGEVMGKLHPHGDSAIYDAMVRLAQGWEMSVPLVDGHGNFGSLDDGPAASRYCVTGGTHITLADGRTMPIDAVVPDASADTDYDIDLMVRGHRSQPVHASKLFHSGQHPVLTMTLGNGMAVSGTSNHLVLTLANIAGIPLPLWKQLDELAPGDYVAVDPAAVPVRTPGDAPERHSDTLRVPFIQSFLTASHPGVFTRAALELIDTPLGWRLHRDLVLSHLDGHESAGIVTAVMDLGYAYSPVTRLDPGPVSAVYSLRVDTDDHAFVTNGIISHNTEARLAPGAVALVDSIDEDTVDMRPNYDDREVEPVVLPCAYPNLLVNGGAGIAVGMATNIPPHNLGEAIDAARHLLTHPDASLEDIMEIIPGPDFPTGGHIVGTDGIVDAYRTGRGQIRMRATATIEDVSARRKGIVITQLPYGIGPEKITTAIKAQQDAKHLAGVSRVVDLTDRKHGLRMIVEVKTGANPAAVLAELYQRTPLETAFNVNAVALVDGQPRTLGLLDMLRVYVDHRLEVVRRRTLTRRAKAEARAHIVDGLLLALADIDEVVKVLRSSKDTDQARTRLKKTFKLSDIQVQHILEMPLRRLVSLEVGRLRQEREELGRTIDYLSGILSDPAKLVDLVSDELQALSDTLATPRRCQILSSEAAQLDAGPAEVVDADVLVVLGAGGQVARTAADGDHVSPAGVKKGRGKHDLVISRVTARTRGQVGLLTSGGVVHRVDVVGLPVLAPGQTSLAGLPVSAPVSLADGERVIAVVDVSGSNLLMATSRGTVKHMAGEWPARGDAVPVISLKEGDDLVFGVSLPADDSGDVILVSSDTQLLRFPLSTVRAQGRSSGGMAGIRLADGSRVVAGAYSTDAGADVVVTVAGTVDGTGAGVKVTPLSAYPVKGRGTAGVRCMRLLRGETHLLTAHVGAAACAGATVSGDPVTLPDPTDRRDASGTETPKPCHLVGQPLKTVVPKLA